MLTYNSLDELIKFKHKREISWLEFNKRVLEEAYDADIPILERLKFVSIYATNLDEFFMIRVGSLYDKSIYTPDVLDNKSGQTPAQQLNDIYKTVHSLKPYYNNAYRIVEDILRNNSIYSLDFHELSNTERTFVKNYFNEHLYPILSPQIVDPHHPFPHLRNKELYIACLLKNKNKNIFGIVPIPEQVAQLIFIPGKDYMYIHVEKIILEYVDKIFGTYKMNEKTCISVTRNADITPDDDSIKEHIDFRNQMKELLHLRKKLAVVRLETNNKLSEYLLNYLCENLSISKDNVFETRTPLKMDYVFGLISRVTKKRHKDLLYPEFVPVNSIDTDNLDLLQFVSKKDLLFHYPYESMKPFLNLLKQAANDSNVLSIKITIYRLALKTKIVDYLCTAAENGKDVTVLIELRARFDEQNNIDWSEKLEDAGCKVLYGIEDFKVHSKICLITYKDKGNIKFITQIGTGNYNEKTAELYTDFSLITGNYEIGLDATEYFKNMSIGNLNGLYNHLLFAPYSLKTKLLNLMDEEIEKGENGRVFFKINSITDIDIINKLAECSVAGVQIIMVVRGICCILPGVPGATENISIRSIVGRFLEHTRVFSFGSGESQTIYISSADLMTRNLDRRVEVASPIYDPDVKKKINEVIETVLSDNVKARMIDSKGNYNKINDNGFPFNSQEFLIQQTLLRGTINTRKEKPIFKRLLDFFRRKF